MGELRQDLGFAVRQLRRSPAFLLTAVLTLALGIGATTAIFTLVHAVLLKSLPVTRPNELVRIGNEIHCCNWSGYAQGKEFSLFSTDLYRHFRRDTPAFLDLAAFQAGATQLGVRRAGSTQPAEMRKGEFVSGNFFRTFGVGAWDGRVLNEEDDREGANSVAVLAYHTWQQKYAGDRSVVGSTLLINGQPFTVVGIAAPEFYGPNQRSWALPDLWLPLTAEPMLTGRLSQLKVPAATWLECIGRVRPGTDLPALQAQLRLELQQWLTSHLPDMDNAAKEALPQQTLFLTPGGAGVTQMREQYKDSLRLLLAAAGCVLSLACANLANLLLARGLRDRQQTSVRVALGASRFALIRRALVESVLLGVLGGIGGVGLAYLGTRMILAVAFTGTEYVPLTAAPSYPVLLFALAVSLLTGVAFGVGPALLAAKADPIEALRGAQRTTSGGALWPQRALVIGQAAIALVLVSAAMMLGQSLRNLQRQDLGFQPKDKFLVTIDAKTAGYAPDRLLPLFERLQQRLERIPGVRSVGAATYAPMSGDSWNTGVRVQGRPEPQANDDDSAGWTRITPGFLATLGNRVLSGRDLSVHDTATSPRVVVINQAFARKFFKGADPIGKRFGRDAMSHAGDYEIVGVAEDMRYLTYSLKDPVDARYYLPEAQTVRFDKETLQQAEDNSQYLANLVVWAPGGPSGLEAQVHSALQEVDPNLVLESFDSYRDVLHGDFSQQNMLAKLTLAFGVLALGLAAIGLYGVTAYGVEQRTAEIGVRMALGANRLAVLRMVLKGAVLQAGVGLAIGVPAMVGLGRAISSQLYAVRAVEPRMLAAAASLLCVTALLAAALPARRAAGVNPMQALRGQ